MKLQIRLSCAHLYALTTNGQPGNWNDPWANDQDWALVNLLTIRQVESTVQGQAPIY